MTLITLTLFIYRKTAVTMRNCHKHSRSTEVQLNWLGLFFFPACNVLYINSVDMESLTGPQAVAKAISETLAAGTPPTATVVHFKVSAQGITLTDNQRK